MLDYYRSEDDVIEAFKRNQAKLRKQQEIMSQKQKEQGGHWGGLFGRRLFGGQCTQVMLPHKLYTILSLPGSSRNDCNSTQGLELRLTHIAPTVAMEPH